MGTRSLTRVFDERGDEILCMYRQHDGYPSGHGQDLADFLSGVKLVNGIPFTTKRVRMANGMGCLAAQIVVHFKSSSRATGGIYLHKPGTSDVGEEYVYVVKEVGGSVDANGARVPWKLSMSCWRRFGAKTLYEGPPEDFAVAGDDDE